MLTQNTKITQSKKQLCTYSTEHEMGYDRDFE